MELGGFKKIFFCNAHATKGKVTGTRKYKIKFLSYPLVVSVYIYIYRHSYIYSVCFPMKAPSLSSAGQIGKPPSLSALFVQVPIFRGAAVLHHDRHRPAPYVSAIVCGYRSNEASASVGLDDVAVHDVSLDESGENEVGEGREQG
jgi:hypothetical protein